MTIELWGTFSVRDHLEPRAFVADVLLYDRIVLPTLPDGADPTSWPSAWGLVRQKQLLTVLDDLAVPIPWTDERRREWQTRFDADSACERAMAKGEAAIVVQQDAAFAATRGLLADYANRTLDDVLVRRLLAFRKVRPGATLEAVAAYPSYERFEHDVPMSKPLAWGARTVRTPTQVFGWEFFVPEHEAEDQKTDLALLEKAIELATNSEFIELRGLFYGFWRDIVEAEVTVEEARGEMEKRYGEYRKIMEKQAWKSRGRFAIKVANVLSGGLAEVACDAVATTAETMLGGVEIVGEKLLCEAAAEPRLKAAAMFHDARRRFGWKAR